MTTPTTRTALVNGRILSSSGTLEAVADGTLAEADRVVIDGDHIAEVRRSVDHLILDLLADTARQIGIPTSELESLGRQYLDCVARLGLVP